MKKRGLAGIAALSLVGVGLSVLVGCKAATPAGTITLESAAKEFWANQEYTVTAKVEGENFDLANAKVKFTVPAAIAEYKAEGNALSFKTKDEAAKDVVIAATLYTDATETTAVASGEFKFNIHKTTFELALSGQKTTFKQGDEFEVGDLAVSLIETNDGVAKEPVAVSLEDLVITVDGKELPEHTVFTEIAEHEVKVLYEAKNIEATYKIDVEVGHLYQLGQWFENEFKGNGLYEFALSANDGTESYPIAHASVGEGDGFYADAANNLYYREVELNGGLTGIENIEYIREELDSGEVSETIYDHGIVRDNFTEPMQMEEFKEKHADKLLNEFEAVDFAGFEVVETEEALGFTLNGKLSEDNFASKLVEKFVGVEDLLEAYSLTDLDFEATAAINYDANVFMLNVAFDETATSGEVLNANLVLYSGADEAIAPVFAAIDKAMEEERVETAVNYGLRYLSNAFAGGNGSAYIGATASGTGASGIFDSMDLMHVIKMNANGLNNMALTYDHEDEEMYLYPYLTTGFFKAGTKQYLLNGQILDAGEYYYSCHNKAQASGAPAYTVQPLTDVTTASIDDLGMNLKYIPGLMVETENESKYYDADLWNYEGSSDFYQLEAGSSKYVAYDETYTLYGSYLREDGSALSPLSYYDYAFFYEDELGLEAAGIDAAYKTEMTVTYAYVPTGENTGSWIYYGWNMFLYGANSSDLDENLGLIDVWELSSRAGTDYAFTYLKKFGGLTDYINAVEITGVSDMSLNVSGTATLNPQAVGANGAAPTEAAVFTYASDNESVVTVNENGELNAQAVGEANITITDTTHNISVTIKVTVTEAATEGEGSGNEGSENQQPTPVRPNTKTLNNIKELLIK